MPPHSFTENQVLELLQAHVDHRPDLSLRLQDDCGLLPASKNPLLLTTDVLIEGTHFRREWSGMQDLAHKCLNVNLSDIAAKGGKPLGFLFSWGLSNSWSFHEIEDFCKELGRYSREMYCPLIGGNTSRAQQSFLSVTLVAEVTSQPVKERRLAKAGDLICVTGTLGDARAGLELLETGRDGFPFLKTSQRRGRARLHEGQALNALAAVHATMDISDGLRQDLLKMSSVSQLGFQVDVSKLPISHELQNFKSEQAASYALAGGEDYELLVAIQESEFSFVQKALRDQGCSELSVLGNFTKDLDQVFSGNSVELPDFKHFV